jgi:hypothetical protein
MAGFFVLAGFLVIALGLIALGYVERKNRARLAAMTPEERAAYDRDLQDLADAQARATQTRLAAAGSRSRSARSLLMNPTAGKANGGRPACPRCGSEEFQAKASARARVGSAAAGFVGAAVTRPTQVSCASCGTRYVRG